MLRVKLYYL